MKNKWQDSETEEVYWLNLTPFHCWIHAYKWNDNTLQAYVNYASHTTIASDGIDFQTVDEAKQWCQNIMKEKLSKAITAVYALTGEAPPSVVVVDGISIEEWMKATEEVQK